MPRLLVRTGLVVALVAAPLWARAEPPSGSYAIDLPADPGIVLPTDLEENDCETVEGVTICASGQLTTDGAGAIGGDAMLAFSGEIEGELAGYFDGKVAGQAGDPRVTLSMLLEGELTSQGQALEILASSRARCARNALAGGFDCSGSVKLCAYYFGARIGCESEAIAYFVEDEHRSVAAALGRLDHRPGRGGDGHGRGRTLERAGVQLRRHRQVQLAQGQLVAEAGRARTARGSKLRLASVALSGGAATGGTLDYQIAGQKGRATLPLPAPVVFVGSTCLRGAFCDTAADTANFFSGARNPDPFQDEAIIIYGFSSYP